MNEPTRPFSNETDIAVFSAIPWCNTIMTDPNYTIVKTDPRRFQSNSESTDIFMTQTLATQDTIRACVVLHHRKQSASAMAEVSEILALCDLGPKLSAIPNIAHGGVISTLLDHFTGLLIRINSDAIRARDPDFPPNLVYMTLKLDIIYRKAVSVPGVVAVRAWYDKSEGRKRWLKARIENATGAVLAEGEALYLEVRRPQATDPGGKL